MNLQTRYDLEVAEDEIAAKVACDVQPLETVTAPEALEVSVTLEFPHSFFRSFNSKNADFPRLTSHRTCEL